MSRATPRVLCVDDDARVLEGLSLHLRKEYEVHTALGGERALQLLRELKGVAVIISDMRMPGMDGATLLNQVMRMYPDTVVQYRLINAEREILQETVLGCIKALIDVLAITNPASFGRASRVKRVAMEFATSLGSTEFWQLEAAAMLSQIGYLSLPAELVDKLYYGEKLTPEEQVIAGGVPKVAINLLEHIPRLEPVLQILTALTWRSEAVARLGEGTIGTGTRILALVLDYDSMIVQGHAADVAVQTLRTRPERYGEKLIEQFAAHLGAGAGQNELREMPLEAVAVGMTMMQELRTHMGTLLVPRGFEVTPTFLERIRNFGPDLLAEKVKVLVPVAKPLSTHAA
jgi:response regulator RpfG family c-di-GMP phosphodiesterase